MPPAPISDRDDDPVHFLILSGANERAIVASCRHLESEGIGFSIIARPRRDPLPRSPFRSRVLARRRLDSLDIEDIVATIRSVRDRMPERVLYLPASEALNRLFLAHRDRLQSECRLEITLPSAAIYATVSDKASFNALAETFRIAIPATLPSADNAAIPFVAKPCREFSAQTGKKLYPELILTEAQRRAFLAGTASGEFFCQRYIDGTSYYYLFFFAPDGRDICLIQRNLAQQPHGKSILAAETSPDPDPVFHARIVDCIRSTGFTGFCMVEMMLDETGSYLIEANPRLWGPFSLALDAGFRLRWLAAPQTSSQPEPGQKTVRYAWLSGMLRTLLDGESIRWFPNTRSHCLARTDAQQQLNRSFNGYA